MRFLLQRVVAVISVTLLGLTAMGCRSTDEDASSRPWNSPKGWESGIPSSMTEGR
jgi:hypothetical protein